jgi:hypothetical protein
VEDKVFINVFKLCTFSTDHIKESVGEVQPVHSGTRHR